MINKYMLWACILFTVTLGCKPRSLSRLQIDSQNQTQTNIFPPTTVVPPIEFQTGGDELFDSLKPLRETHPDLVSVISDRVYLNQKLDLSLLGQGSNVIFVYDGKNWIFAFSNGRFDSDEQAGSIRDGSYPLKKEQNVSEEMREGKYPWPIDSKGHYLPGNKLVTSNGPHSKLKEILESFARKPSQEINDLIVAGHIGVDRDGMVYIGYISGANNNAGEFSNEKRAMGTKNRQRFHEGAKAACVGRNIDEVLTSAPTSNEDVLRQNSINFYPSSGSKYRVEYTKRSHLELLEALLTRNDLEEYLAKVGYEKIFDFLINPNAAERVESSSSLKKWMSSSIEAYITAKGINYQNNDGRTLLHRALSSPLFLKTLLSWGADPNIKDNSGLAALNYAVINNNSTETIEALISGGADLNIRDKDGETPLHLAIKVNNVKVIKTLISKGADPNIKDNFGRTALYIGAKDNNTEAIKALVAGGADPNIKINADLTPLHFVANHNNTEAIKILISGGADPNIKDKDGKTALRRAANHNNTEAIETLVSMGADPNIKDKDGETALHWAAYHNNIKAIEALVSVGADSNIKDKDGETALHWAAYENNKEAIEALVARGADPNLVDRGDISNNRIKEMLFEIQRKTQSSSSYCSQLKAAMYRLLPNLKSFF